MMNVFVSISLQTNSNHDFQFEVHNIKNPNNSYIITCKVYYFDEVVYKRKKDQTKTGIEKVVETKKQKQVMVSNKK